MRPQATTRHINSRPMSRIRKSLATTGPSCNACALVCIPDGVFCCNGRQITLRSVTGKSRARGWRIWAIGTKSFHIDDLLFRGVRNQVQQSSEQLQAVAALGGHCYANVQRRFACVACAGRISHIDWDNHVYRSALHYVKVSSPVPVPTESVPVASPRVPRRQTNKSATVLHWRG